MDILHKIWPRMMTYKEDEANLNCVCQQPELGKKNINNITGNSLMMDAYRLALLERENHHIDDETQYYYYYYYLILSLKLKILKY